MLFPEHQLVTPQQKWCSFYPNNTVSLILLLLTEALLSREHMLLEAEVNRHHRATTTEAHSYALENGGGGLVPLQPPTQ